MPPELKAIQALFWTVTSFASTLRMRNLALKPETVAPFTTVISGAPFMIELAPTLATGLIVRLVMEAPLVLVFWSHNVPPLMTTVSRMSGAP